jgi:ketopantoate reductase
MDKLNQYRKLIRQVIEENASYSSSDGVVETEIIADSILDHYELIRVGWEGEHRINGAVLHIDIRNSKIYIQHDGTELSAAKRLVEYAIE